MSWTDAWLTAMRFAQLSRPEWVCRICQTVWQPPGPGGPLPAPAAGDRLPVERVVGGVLSTDGDESGRGVNGGAWGPLGGCRTVAPRLLKGWNPSGFKFEFAVVALGDTAAGGGGPKPAIKCQDFPYNRIPLMLL